MDLTRPARSVVPSIQAEVLVALAGITMPVTGRQISRLIESKSHSGVGSVLERLRESGLVDVVEAGNANLYSLNRDHVAAPAVLALMDLRGKLFAQMAEQVRSWQILPDSVAIFGSAARGDGGVNSDIDILIVRPEELEPNRSDNPGYGFEIEPEEDAWSNIWSSQVFELSRLTQRWSGNRASLLQVTKAQLVALVERREPMADSLRRDAIYIWGPNVMKSIGGLA